MKHQPRGIRLWVLSFVAIGFGILTIREGGAVLFIDGAARAAAGHYVPFVLWINFVAGFTYVVAGIGLWLQRRWATWLAAAIAAVAALTFVAFAMHVFLGGAYEQRTVIAMSLRTLAWIMIAIVARVAIPPRRLQTPGRS